MGVGAHARGRGGRQPDLRLTLTMPEPLSHTRALTSPSSAMVVTWVDLDNQEKAGVSPLSRVRCGTAGWLTAPASRDVCDCRRLAPPGCPQARAQAAQALIAGQLSAIAVGCSRARRDQGAEGRRSQDLGADHPCARVAAGRTLRGAGEGRRLVAQTRRGRNAGMLLEERGGGGVHGALSRAPFEQLRVGPAHRPRPVGPAWRRQNTELPELSDDRLQRRSRARPRRDCRLPLSEALGASRALRGVQSAV